MTVGIYIRVSTEEQAKEGFSISAQREKLQAYCIAQGWGEFKFYVDEGLSAKNMERPLLKALLKHIETGLIDTVLVYKLDRLTRSVVDLHNMLNFFDKYDCSFKSATEVYDTSSAMGRFFITIISSVAQFERENTSERVSFGMEERARQGKYIPAAPFGFTKGDDGYLIPNEEAAEPLRDVISKIMRGYSLRQCAAYLDNLGVRPRRSKDVWKANTLKLILTNPALYGATKWADKVFENTHQGIITKDEFESLKKIIDDRSSKGTYRSPALTHIFSGKIICEKCGYRMSITRTKYKDRFNNDYRCSNCKVYHTHTSISERKMLKAFDDYIYEFKLVQFDISKETKTVNKQTRVEKQIVSLTKKREKYQKGWALDLIEDDEFSKLMKDTQIELEELEMELQKYTAITEQKFDKIAIKNIVKNIKENWSELSIEERKDFVNMFIKDIHYVKNDGIATITKIDFY
ncbi:recombinase family protein [Listeria grandensis]|uniref:Recombinase family protein n=1 Tax=Listeria grandensis TaxID=1494963 RepID=A0A7X0Y1E0_9LIST|nr:recombinase family protein [Listeria grandensis]MBC1935236.1 recombinase family protein [Listeria grandensis]